MPYVEVWLEGPYKDAEGLAGIHQSKIQQQQAAVKRHEGLRAAKMSRRNPTTLPKVLLDPERQSLDPVMITGDAIVHPRGNGGQSGDQMASVDL